MSLQSQLSVSVGPVSALRDLHSSLWSPTPPKSTRVSFQPLEICPDGGSCQIIKKSPRQEEILFEILFFNDSSDVSSPSISSLPIVTESPPPNFFLPCPTRRRVLHVRTYKSLPETLVRGPHGPPQRTFHPRPWTGPNLLFLTSRFYYARHDHLPPNTTPPLYTKGQKFVCYIFLTNFLFFFTKFRQFII